jgi:solute carrier family 45 protein 1/2/4
VAGAVLDLQSVDEAIRLENIQRDTMAEGDSPRRRSQEGQPNVSPALSGETEGDDPVERVSKPVHEESPLLSPSGNSEEDGLMGDEADLQDDLRDDSQETKNLWYMILLTISIGGLQLAWCVELSNGTPYLLSLGLSKSLMALVWIAGPLSGALVQPYVGILSDNCRSKWGKRTPFMVVGSVATVLSLLALAWVREIVSGFLGLFGASKESEGVKVSIIVVAVVFVYILDFSINTGREIVFFSCAFLTIGSAGWNSSFHSGLLSKSSTRSVSLLACLTKLTFFRGCQLHGK